MANKGGYQIINLDPKSISSGVGVKINGAYAAANGANRKRCIISGLHTASKSYPDFNANMLKASAGYVSGAVTVGNSSISTVIAANDTVTVTIS